MAKSKMFNKTEERLLIRAAKGNHALEGKREEQMGKRLEEKGLATIMEEWDRIMQKKIRSIYLTEDGQGCGEILADW